MVIEIVLLLIIITYGVFHFRRKRLYKLASEFQGPKPLPIVGNALKCIMPYSEMVGALLKSSEYYKSPVKFWFGPSLITYVYSPEDVKAVLNNSRALHKPPMLYKMIEFILGNGLLTSPVDVWKRHRRLISPSFSQNNLENYFNVFVKHSKGFVKNLNSRAGCGVFEVEEYAVVTVLNIILESLLGFKSDKLNTNVAHEMVPLIKELFTTSMSRLSNIMYLPDCIFKVSPPGRKFLKAKKKFDAVIDSIIENWKDDIKNNFETSADLNDCAGSTTPRNFVEHLLLTYDEIGKLSLEELHEEIHTMLVAGLETTSYTFAYLLILLGMHEDIQVKVYEEIKTVIGNRTDITYADIKDLTYLERVIKETMRILPVSVGIARYSEQDIKLDDKRIVPANTNIAVGILSLHRDPTIWPNPTKFDPDRFLPEEIAKRHPYSWIPFSAGARNCIGYQYAMLALKVMAIHFVLNYKIQTPYKTVDDLKLTILLVLKAAEGYLISIENR